MFAATAYKLLQFFLDGHTLNSTDATNLIAGNIVAFIVAWIAIRSFINFLTKNGFKVFGYYRIIIGIVLLVLHYSGYEFGML
jgi:undecaprenyl-diphosphatase